MTTEILMPALSPTMEEGKLSKWLIKEGDKVSAGDIIAEIETDKATMEFEAVDDGIVTKILVIEGAEGVLVNSPIAIITDETIDVSFLKKYVKKIFKPVLNQVRLKFQTKQNRHTTKSPNGVLMFKPKLKL
jgi:pyruvate/2-oxoglutarate dehydrogenase complex dihydrolipoamide acyltransferase (E2) component